MKYAINKNYLTSAKCIILLLLVVFNSNGLQNLAFADSDQIHEALQKKDAAINDYYQGLLDLGPSATAEQKAQLRSRTVDIGNNVFGSAIRAKLSELGNSVRKKIADENKKLINIESLFTTTNSEKDIKDIHLSDPNAMTSSNQLGKYTQINDIPEKPADVLDGSKVPKEIEFTGKPRLMIK